MLLYGQICGNISQYVPVVDENIFIIKPEDIILIIFYNQVVKALFVFLFCFYSTLVQAITEDASNQGIVFIHGTSDHREDADGGYWKTDFMQSVAQHLPKPDNYYVVHCDFSQYMWHEEAADCVVKQIHGFVNEKHISHLTVYTHSNGGNIMRWILSNPAYNNQYSQVAHKIKQVVAIAPSSGGSPLADEIFHGGSFESNLAWLFSYATDALKQQRIGDMLIYNEQLLFGTKGRPSLSAPFKVIVGTDVLASPFSTASYCNGYMINAALKVSKLYLDECSDGVLNCSSQIKAGDLWFYDKEKTQDGGPLNHNQSRHSCLGFDSLLAQALSSEGAVQ